MIISVWKVLFMSIIFSTNDLVHRDQYLVYNCVYKLPPPPPLLTQYVDNTLLFLRLAISIQQCACQVILEFLKDIHIIIFSVFGSALIRDNRFSSFTERV